MDAGQKFTVTGERLIAGGDGLARIDGFPLFVPHLYPQDRALVRLTEVRKGFGRGEIVELLAPSPLRRESPCPVAGLCGGCDWTSLRLDAQLTAKREILIDSLRRIGKFDPESLPRIAIHPSPLAYRLRSRLHRSMDAIGFFAAKSHEVIPIPDVCEVVGPRTLAATGAMRETTEPGASVVTFETEQWIDRASPEESDGVEESIDAGGFRYSLSMGSFFQVNRHLLDTLIGLVTASASHVTRRETALDLYGGVGFFALPLSRMFTKVISVESDRGSHRWARLNAAQAVNVQAIHADVHHFLKRGRTASFIFVDPPRAGLAPEVVDAVATLAEERICHLSCDPVTFSRDAARLTQRGWKRTSLDLVDLFPNTHHVETLSSFVRA